MRPSAIREGRALGDTSQSASSEDEADHVANRFPGGYAVLIGVGHTHNVPDYSLPDTVTDARALERVLQDPELGGYHENHVHCLCNEDASASRIRSELQWLSERAVDDATAIVYFSGHGWKTGLAEFSHDDKYCLVASDVALADIQNSVLWVTEFVELLGAIKAKHLLVLIDACREAAIERYGQKGGESSLPEGFTKGAPLEILSSAFKHSRNRVILSASGPTQMSYTYSFPPDRIRMGIFTYHVREALCGKATEAHEARVSISDLITHVCKEVPITARKLGFQQEPWVSWDQQDFPLAMRRVAQMSADIRKTQVIDKPPFPIRVLVVDDEKYVRTSHELALKGMGYQAILALGNQPDLERDAELKAHRHRCHLALVDMQLAKNMVPRDMSGQRLVSGLLPALSIIVSGSDDGIDRTDAMAMTRSMEGGAVGYVKKGHDDLAIEIAKVLKEHWNLHLKYDWKKTGYTPEGILTCLRPDRPELAEDWQCLIDEMSDEVDNALCRLYNDAKITELYLEPIADVGNPYQTPLDPLSGRRSVVLYATPLRIDSRPQLRQVIKFAPREHVLAEVKNYEEFVADQLDHTGTALIKGSYLSWDIGVIRYSDETAHRQRFTEWYRKHDADMIPKAVANLFGVTLARWHTSDNRRSTLNVYEYYVSEFKKLARQIETYPQRDEWLQVGDLPYKLPNPILWVTKHSSASQFLTRCQTIIHGDLHADNIFVGDDASTCIIDYERSGLGYFLRDFVELEKDISLRLLELQENDLNLAYHFHCLLLAPRSSADLPLWKVPVGYAANAAQVVAMQKAFEAIHALRKALLEVSKPDSISMDEYYWALLMETLFSMTDSKASSRTHDLATLSAALICEHLRHWPKPISPVIWSGHVREDDPSHSAQKVPPVSSAKVVELFYAYSHKDETLRDHLEDHLSILRHEGVIINWHDRKIMPGSEWDNVIDEHLESSDIILLLVSANFLASRYCYGVEMQRALQRHDAAQARVIPVILRDVDWRGAPFGKLQALPKDAKPITSWSNREAAFRNVAEGIRRAAEEIRAHHS
jgi:CheY-like chemotaxis protein